MKKTTDKDRTTADEIIDESVMLIHHEDCATAAEHLQQALRIYRDITAENPDSSKDRAQLAKVLNNLGYAYAELSQYEDAEKCFGECLDIRRKLYTGTKSEYIMQTIHLLICLHLDMQKYSAVIAEAQEALDNIFPNYHEPGYDTIHATLLGNMAYAYQQTGDRASALKTYQKSYGIHLAIYQNFGFIYAGDFRTLVEHYTTLLRATNHDRKASQIVREAERIEK